MNKLTTPNALSIADIYAAAPYWLEIIPYTAQLSVGANLASSLFNVTNINRSQPPATGLFLTGLGATQLANMRVDLTYDTNTEYGYGSAFLSNLNPKGMYKIATSNMAVKITNESTTKTIIPFINYFATVWQMPIIEKAMLGSGLTSAETTIANKAGVPTTSNNQNGTVPIPFETIIERTYANRRTDQLTKWLTPTATDTEQSIDYMQTASAQEILILRNIATEANEDDYVNIIVDRDDNTSHVNISAANCNLDEGFDILIPATSTLNVKIQANTTLTYPTPVRLTYWRCNVSNILAFRLGIMNAASATTANLEKLYYDIIAGVR